MGGMYNAIHGENPFAGELLMMIGIERSQFLRYRDAYVKDGKVIVYTRNGGANRTGEIGEFMRLIRKYTGYVSDKDDDFDNTYAYITFSVKSEYLERMKEIEEEQGPVLTVGEKCKKFCETGVSENPSGVNAVLNALREAMKGVSNE
jgi:hypothetical protein